MRRAGEKCQVRIEAVNRPEGDKHAEYQEIGSCGEPAGLEAPAQAQDAERGQRAQIATAAPRTERQGPSGDGEGAFGDAMAHGEGGAVGFIEQAVRRQGKQADDERQCERRRQPWVTPDHSGAGCCRFCLAGRVERVHHAAIIRHTEGAAPEIKAIKRRLACV